MDQPTLHLKISSPGGIVFEGDVFSVSSKNLSGKFDILPQHANFITLIENEPINIILPNREKKSFNFPFAIVYNSKSFVRIYTDIQGMGAK